MTEEHEHHTRSRGGNGLFGLALYFVTAATGYMGVSNAVHKPISVRYPLGKGVITAGLWPEYEAFSKAGVKNAFWKGIWNINIWPYCEAYSKGGVSSPFWKGILTFFLWPQAEAASKNGVTNPVWKSIATKGIWTDVEAQYRLEERAAH
jgi:hypothetical protein